MNNSDPSGNEMVGVGLQLSVSLSFGLLSISAGFELIWFWSKSFDTSKSSRFLVYFFFEPFNGSISQVAIATELKKYYNKIKFNPKKLFAKPSFNASIALLTLFVDTNRYKTFNYIDYTEWFNTSTVALWGIKTFKSTSTKFTVFGAGKYWGMSGRGWTKSKSYYWMVWDLGNALIALFNSIKANAK